MIAWHRARVAVTSLTLGASLFACGVEEASAPIAPREPPTAATSSPPAFAIHEWGLIELHAMRGDLALVTAGAPPDPSCPPLGSSYKPVIYAHLRGTESVRFSLSIDVGDVLEVFPPPATPQRAEWVDVLARNGPCGPLRYPSGTCATSDGLCEAAEGASYESSDGACLEVGGEPHDFLLYRSRVPRVGLPFDLEESADATAIVAREGASRTRLVRVRTDGELTGAAVDRAEGGPLPELEAGSERAEDVVDALLAGARDAGLTEAEASTFARVWRPEITGANAPADAVYYWLDRASVERVLPMRVEPAPAEIARAFLVRMVVRGAPDACAAPFRSRLARIPRVRIGEVRVRGALAPAVVRRVMRRQVNQVRFCYERALNADATLEGDVAITVDIGEDGGVTSARVASTTVGEPTVAPCIAEAARGWRFPAPRGGAASIEAAFDLDSLE